MTLACDRQGNDVVTTVADTGHGIDPAFLPHEDGYSLLRRIHAQRNRPPVVALTGLTRPEDKERVEPAGFSAFVAKPIDLPHLVTILHDLFPGAPRS